MLAHFRPRAPSPAMVVALVALFVALGGGAYAALKLPKNSVGSTQIKNNAVTSAKVKNFSLVAKDFKAGQLPRGPAGPVGPVGPRGLEGPRGPMGHPGPGGALIFAQAQPAGEDPPASPTFVTPTLSFNLPASGKLDVSGFIDATGSCPTGPDDCTFETGLYLDGVAIPETGFSYSVQQGTLPISCGGASLFSFGGFGLAASVPAGNHVLSIGYLQTGGATAPLSFDCEPFLQAIGPYQ